jgi:hypothetical protein
MLMTAGFQGVTGHPTLNAHHVPSVMKDEFEEPQASGVASRVIVITEEKSRAGTEGELDQWDHEDKENIQCVSQYAKEIFACLRQNEVIAKTIPW